MKTFIFAKILFAVILVHPSCSFPKTDLGKEETDTLQDSPENPGFRPNWQCGTKSLNQNHNHRQKRYVLQGSRWKVNPITYNITVYPSESVMTKEVVDREISYAFRMWEEVTNLTITRVMEGKVHIEIRFEVRNHGDDEPFDGRGGMTAHAYYPSYGGDIHFDADELWTSRSPMGINLFQVATHEIGHALGLEHTDDLERTVMSPYYVNYDINFKLHRDDIEGIQYLYGKKSYSVCEYSKIDAATQMVDGAVYIFRQNLVYKFSSFEGPLDSDYPKEISKAFDGLMGPIDAAFTRSNGVTYFFKGDQFWRFTNLSMDTDFPQKVSEYFPNIPTPIDAAIVFPKDDKIYFLRESHYWRYDHTSPTVSTDHPKPLRDWKGIPSNLDAALRIQTKDGIMETYLFKDEKYWKFNDRSLSVYISNPPYPRNTRNLFSGCNVKS